MPFNSKAFLLAIILLEPECRFKNHAAFIYCSTSVVYSECQIFDKIMNEPHHSTFLVLGGPARLASWKSQTRPQKKRITKLKLVPDVRKECGSYDPVKIILSLHLFRGSTIYSADWSVKRKKKEKESPKVERPPSGGLEPPTSRLSVYNSRTISNQNVFC